MTNKKLVLPATFTDNTLPTLQPDAVFPNAGALALFELAHPANPYSGVPANSAVVPNIAISQAQVMYPSGTTTTLGATFNVGATFDTGGIRERTTKGGLHLAASTTSLGDLNRKAWFVPGVDFFTYMNANQAHSYYISMWGNVTRKANSTAGGVNIGNMASGFNLPYFYVRPSSAPAGPDVYPVTSYKTGYRAYGGVGTNASDGTSKADTGAFMYSGAVSSLAGTVAAGAFAQAGDFVSGAAAGVSRYSALVFYRFYVEDLTVSGRSYATVDALDFSQFQTQVLNAGGRYYGDTWSADPA